MIRILLALFIIMCLINYYTLRRNKYSGLRKVFPTVVTFFLCIIIVICFLNMLRYQIGFESFLKELFSGF